jgi:hypothetical protein
MIAQTPPCPQVDCTRRGTSLADSGDDRVQAIAVRAGDPVIDQWATLSGETARPWRDLHPSKNAARLLGTPTSTGLVPRPNLCGSKITSEFPANGSLYLICDWETATVGEMRRRSRENFEEL